MPRLKSLAEVMAEMINPTPGPFGHPSVFDNSFDSVDILKHIASHLVRNKHHGTAANLLRVNKAAYEATGDLLYENLTITQRNVHSVFFGLIELRGEDGKSEEIAVGRKGAKPVKGRNPAAGKAVVSGQAGAILSASQVQTDHYNDYATILDLGFPPLHLDIWPAHIPSSYQRKLRLLSYTKKLTFDDIPPKSISVELTSLLTSRILFASVKHLIYTVNAIWRLAHWEEAEEMAEDDYIIADKYDFSAMIKVLVRPTDMCVTCPKVLNMQDMKRYAMAGWNAIPHASLPKSDWRNDRLTWDEDLETRLGEYLCDISMRMIEDLASAHATLRTLTTHGLNLSSFPKIDDIHHRIFLSNCRSHPNCSRGQSCFYPPRTYGLPCGSYWGSQFRSIVRDDRNTRRSGLVRPVKKTSWELINLDSEGKLPRDGPEATRHVMWGDLERAQEVVGSGKMVSTRLEDAEICGCCGAKDI